MARTQPTRAMVNLPTDLIDAVRGEAKQSIGDLAESAPLNALIRYYIARTLGGQSPEQARKYLFSLPRGPRPGARETVH